MGFAKIPSKVIYGSKSFVDFYKFVGDDDDWSGGDYIFYINGDYVMTQGFIKFKFTGDNGLGDLEYDNEQYGGEPCFTGGSSWKLYYCPSRGKWILTQNAPFYGYMPKTDVRVTYYDGNYEYDYRGDLWWESSTLNTTPYGDNKTGGTFTFGIDSSTASEWGLTQYSSITYTLAGDIGNYQYWKRLSGSGACGLYEGNFYVGYPTWTYLTNTQQTRYVVKYGTSKWYNLEYINTRYIDDEYLRTRWRGYIIPEFGRPNLDTERGWYATQTEPTAGSNFTLQWYHWVWTDPDDHDEGGSVVQESSWTDDDDVVHPMPDKTITWKEVADTTSLPIPKGNIMTVIDVAEAAIWR